MKIFKKDFEIHFSDIDTYHHVTHTAYATFGTNTRVAWMNSIGIPLMGLLNNGYAGVLVKEQTEFFREILMGEHIHVELKLAGASRDYSAWKFIHNIYKENGKLSAIYTVQGVWIDSTSRKITTPPQNLIDKLKDIASDDNFEELANPRRV